MVQPALKPNSAVIALGGNALIRPGEAGTIERQFEHAAEAMRAVAELARSDARLVLTHGNGPIVGNIVLRGEAARETIPPMPLYIAGADSEGGVGLMLMQSLHNALVSTGVRKPIATLITQVIVDADDPAFGRPTKPIGPYFDEAVARVRRDQDGWDLAFVPGRGWRRVVASPLPRAIVERDTIVTLAEQGHIVIAAGGGGVPVLKATDGTLSGVEAVIDKDWSAALLAVALDVEVFAILMESDSLYQSFGTPGQRRLESLTATEAAELAHSGLLDAGSIGPKVAAAAYAAEACGCVSILCATTELDAALSGSAGTRIVRD
ncbi:MAG: carbamate kinase [Coriobacteriia bacterium]|nr:carbamate kinase [Coriobacteriia bacterium]